MSTPDESADDVRAIRALLTKRTKSRELPFYDQLVWETQSPNNHVHGTANTQLLFGSRQSDERKVYAHYLQPHDNLSVRMSVIGYHEDRHNDVLPLAFMSGRAWRDFRLELPFRHLMEVVLGEKRKKARLAAYVKACFILRGATRGNVYEITENFTELLSRAISALYAVKSGNGARISSSGSTSEKSPHSANLPSGQPPSKASTRKEIHTSTSPSQASEENTMDFDEDDVANPWKRTLPRGASNTRSTDKFGMFLPTKRLSRAQQNGTASQPINSESVDIPTKRKVYGMFSDVLSVKRINIGPGGRDRSIDESSIQDNAEPHPDDADPLDDDETLSMRKYSTAVRYDTGTGRAVLMAVGPDPDPDPGSEQGRATSGRSTTSSLSSPPSSPIPSLVRHHHGLGAILIANGTGTIDIQDENESVHLHKQAEEYLELENFIEYGGARIAILERNAQSHLSKQTTSVRHVQSLEEKASNIEKQFEDEALAKREEVRRRLEAQIAAEIAAIDEDMGKRIALGTAEIHDERTVFAKSIKESLNMRQEEETKIREEQRVLTERRERLQTLKKEGGFDLGEVVTTLRQQKK